MQVDSSFGPSWSLRAKECINPRGKWAGVWSTLPLVPQRGMSSKLGIQPWQSNSEYMEGWRTFGEAGNDSQNPKGGNLVRFPEAWGFPAFAGSFPSRLPELTLWNLGTERTHALMWVMRRLGKTSQPVSPASEWRSEARDRMGSVALKEGRALGSPRPVVEKKENQGDLPQPQPQAWPLGLNHWTLSAPCTDRWRESEGSRLKSEEQLVQWNLPVHDLLAFTPQPPILWWPCLLTVGGLFWYYVRRCALQGF